MQLGEPALRRSNGIYRARDAGDLGISRLEKGGFPGTRVFPGVYSILPPPYPAEARWSAALAYAGDDALLTCLTGAAVMGWRAAVDDEPVWVQLPITVRVKAQGFLRIERTRVFDPGMTRLNLRLASPERILASCATKLVPDDLTAMVALAMRRREVSPDAIARLTSLHPRLPGCRQLRLALAKLEGGAESLKEADTLTALRKLGFPAPRTQVSLFVGGRLVSIADFYYDGVAGFYDGQWHLDYAVAAADRTKRTLLEAAGLQVVVYTKDTEFELLDARLREALTQAAARTGPRGWIAIDRFGKPV